MPPHSSKRSRAGLSLTELVVLVAVMGIVALIFLPYIAQQRRPYGAPRIKCVSNLKNVGLAFRIFATDNNDMFPATVMVSNGVERTSIDIASLYGFISNELSTPKVLLCPEDKRKIEAVSFTNFTAKNISYFASLTAEESSPAAFLGGDRNLMTNGVAVSPGLLALTTNSVIGWTKELHNEQGNVVHGDGSVQQMNNATLKAAAKAQDFGMASRLEFYLAGTNYLVVP